MARLILASTSRYRRELLARLRLPFECRSPAVAELEQPGEAPAEMAHRLAELKAQSVAVADGVVLAADQVASLDGELLRKPGSHDVALRQLLACQGRIAVFHTAAVVVDLASGARWHEVDRTEVHFARLAEHDLDSYLRAERPYDCVGSFKAEGLGVVLFERIESHDPTALLGLPLIWVARTLKLAGLDPLSPSRGRPQ